MSRDGRAAAAFAAEYARTEQLGPEEASELARSTVSLVEWVKAFRRTLAVAKKYPSDHPHREDARRRLGQETAMHLDSFRDIELHFWPDHTRTREGFRIPAATEQELDAFTFFAFYRDGLEMLRLRSGVGRRELDTIVEIIASGGRQRSDDAYLWIWRERFANVDVRVEPKLNAHLAIALAVRGSLSVSADAFLAAFQSASPFHVSGDARQAFTTDSFTALVQQGLDPERATQMLSSPNAEALLPTVRREDIESVRDLLTKLSERQARIEALRNQHFGG